MHQWLTEDGSVHCLHGGTGKVDVAAGSPFVRVNGAPVHIENNPLGRSVSGCGVPHSTTSKPCERTLTVDGGYSQFITIEGKAICLETITGTTDSVPPITYKVSHAGQQMVRSQ